MSAHNLGITAGVTATRYGPQLPVRASQMSMLVLRAYQKAGNICPDTNGIERGGLDGAVNCLTALRVLPPGEGRGSGLVTRGQMAVYLIGLWHSLSGRGLPPPPPTILGPRIAYSSCYFSERFECTEIGVIDLEGNDHRKVPTSGSLPQRIDMYPAWSPDGARIAYIVHYGHEDGTGLWVIDADGTDHRLLTTTGYASPSFAWSPDSARIAYSGLGGDGEAGLWVIDVHGTDERLLADASHVAYVTWSPDGARILYSSYERRAAQGGLWVIDADGTDGRMLAAAGGYVLDVDWSPDGAKIAYSAWLPDVGTWIRVIDPDGTGEQELLGTRLSPEDSLRFRLQFISAP